MGIYFRIKKEFNVDLRDHLYQDLHLVNQTLKKMADEQKRSPDSESAVLESIRFH